jgi:hypothetical protein
LLYNNDQKVHQIPREDFEELKICGRHYLCDYNRSRSYLTISTKQYQQTATET